MRVSILRNSYTPRHHPLVHYGLDASYFLPRPGRCFSSFRLSGWMALVRPACSFSRQMSLALRPQSDAHQLHTPDEMRHHTLRSVPTAAYMLCPALIPCSLVRLTAASAIWPQRHPNSRRLPSMVEVSSHPSAVHKFSAIMPLSTATMSLTTLPPCSAPTRPFRANAASRWSANVAQDPPSAPRHSCGASSTPHTVRATDRPSSSISICWR